ncbi:MAG: 1-phosphofructokinase family hexose kinase [Nitrospinota bacterium]
MILTVSLNPVLQKTIVFSSFREGQVNRSSKYRFDASGKGVNVSRVLAQLGEKFVHITPAGGVFRDFFFSLLEKDGIRFESVESGADIRCCTTVLNKEKGTTTEIVEEAKPVSGDTEPAIRELFLSKLPLADAVILSGARAAGFSSEIFPFMVREARIQKKFVCLDIRGEDLKNALTYSPDIVKPNLPEFFETFFDGEHPDTTLTQGQCSVIKAKMNSLSNRYKTKIVLTNGAEEIFCSCPGKDFRTLRPGPVSAFNTTGCGDAFAAGFVSSFLRTKKIENALNEGVRCAALNAVHVRPGVVS